MRSARGSADRRSHRARRRPSPGSPGARAGSAEPEPERLLEGFSSFRVQQPRFLGGTQAIERPFLRLPFSDRIRPCQVSDDRDAPVLDVEPTGMLPSSTTRPLKNPVGGCCSRTRRPRCRRNVAEFVRAEAITDSSVGSTSRGPATWKSNVIDVAASSSTRFVHPSSASSQLDGPAEPRRDRHQSPLHRDQPPRDRPSRAPRRRAVGRAHPASCPARRRRARDPGQVRLARGGLAPEREPGPRHGRASPSVASANSVNLVVRASNVVPTTRSISTASALSTSPLTTVGNPRTAAEAATGSVAPDPCRAWMFERVRHHAFQAPGRRRPLDVRHILATSASIR